MFVLLLLLELENKRHISLTINHIIRQGLNQIPVTSNPREMRKPPQNIFRRGNIETPPLAWPGGGEGVSLQG